MTNEERLATARRYCREKREYCKEHHLCYACMQKIGEGGTQTHCAVCRKRRNWLAREQRKAWSPEKRAHVAMVQKLWRERQKEARHETNIRRVSRV